ncbi:MAG TPA: SpaA isopeptide-forming pilin-related protein [Acidimicrobiales bacterium]
MRNSKATRVARVVLGVLAVAGLVMVDPGVAHAAKVGNPGGGFGLVVQDGFLRFKTNAFDFRYEGQLAECSDGVNNGDQDQDAAVDYPADAQCTSATDDSETAGGFQPLEPIQFTDGTVAANGVMTFPASGVSFPPQYLYVNADESSGGIVDDFVVTMTFSPLTDFTGFVNPLTGAVSLRMQLRIDLDGGPLDADCQINPIDINALVSGTTSPPGPNTPITGVPYVDGRATIVNNSFSVPGAQFCGSAFFGAVDFNDELNNNLGLPSAAGNNEAQLLVEFTPKRPTAAIVAGITATPATGSAPLTVDFSAGPSTSVRPVASYQWDFTNNGSFDASGVTTSFTYANPGTYTARLRVTDDQGDFDEETKTIIVGVAPPPVGTVVVNKTGAGGAPLPGAGFTLFGDDVPTGGSRGAEDTVAVDGCTTGSAGTCTIGDVPVGVYWLAETVVPAGYSAASPVAVSIGGGDTDTIDIANTPVPGTVVIEKSGTGKAVVVADVLFTTVIDAVPVGGARGAEDVAVAASCTTTASGSFGTCTMTDIALGPYWVVETVPEGHRPVEPVAITVGLGDVPEQGDVITVRVRNRRGGSKPR